LPKAAIIVESFTKTKTIAGFLGKEYKLLASMGHVRDLPEDDMGVDVEHDFAPHYITIPGKQKTITQLKKDLKGIEEVYLASDPDREGEAIAWHLAQVLDLDDPQRIEFNEITEEAVKTALQHPREIDQHRVDAQQARRILDRLVGYQISPLLWKRIGSRGGVALSAGRVQSAALRLICEREREIAAFNPEEYWSLEVELSPQDKPAPFRATVRSKDGEDLDLKAEAQVKPLAAELEQAQYVVSSVEKKPRTRNAQPPFITSTLQRYAANELHFSARKTMLVAEQLYQGVDTGGDTHGLITYMRTDSTRVADQAVAQARALIAKEFGEGFIGPGVRGKKAKGAQEAHEAIRPTDVDHTPEQMRPFLDKDQAALYELIWRRFVASQMAPAKMEQVAVEIAAGPYGLRATGSTVVFPGYLAVMPEKEEDKEVGILAELQPEQELALVQVFPEQHFTKPPPRYTEATLVQELEENGIGRPSTYAAIIETLRQRKYVRMKERSFVATPVGCSVYDYLTDHFPHVVDIEFTSRVEEDLDEVEEGHVNWVELLRRYNDDLEQQLQAAQEEGPAVLEGQTCPKCGGNLLVRYSVRGKFAGCEKYPECDYILNLSPEAEAKEEAEPVGRDCPECGEPLVYRAGWKGQRFIACSGFPKCTYKEQIDAEGNAQPRKEPEKTNIPCEKCGGMMVVRTSKRGPFLGCGSFPRCRNTMPIERLEEGGETVAPAENVAAAPAEAAVTPKSRAKKAAPAAKSAAAPTAKADAPTADGLNLTCDECGAPMVVRRGSRGPFVACTGYPKCKATKPMSAAYEAGYEKPEVKKLEEPCPECGKDLLVRQSKRGPFVGCSGYPKCKFARDLEPAEK
jgi:DNA topoisomerase-1